MTKDQLSGAASMSPRLVRARLWVIGVVLSLLTVGLATRAYSLQIRHRDSLAQEAAQQQSRRLRLTPRRGTIFDRHGDPLAVSVMGASIYADPREFNRGDITAMQAATLLNGVLSVSVDTIAARLDRAARRFAWIKRHVTPEQAERVRALNIRGVGVVEEPQRYYPNRELAAALLGYVDVDGRGIEGIELGLEDELRGAQISVEALRDRRGRVVFVQSGDVRAHAGHDVHLTIDRTIQRIAERELQVAVSTYEAAGGSVVVIDPSTGEVLALASYPTFDPNHPGDYSADHRRLRAVSDRFEPGSTMKPFTIAAALAAGAINARSSIDCEMGQWDIGEDTIHDSHPLGVLSPSQVLAHSSNIGIAKVGFLLGRERLYRSLRRFGFGQRVTTILPGETTGDLRYFDRWYDMDLASISFGQGVSVTTLQLASAMSGIANRGRLMETLLVRQTTAEDHSVIARFEPHLDREVVSASTARLVAEMLTAVTGEDGTGEEASLDGYLVAGKTGTAQKADTVHGGYADGRWVASFVGFVPVDAPRLVIAVVIDEPTIEYHGGVVAAPVFRRVASEALAIQGVPRSDANRLPRAPTAPSDHRAERVRTAPNAVPDFMGLNARDAMLLAGRANVQVRTLGTGVVVAQDPLPFVPQLGVGGVDSEGTRQQVVELRLDLPSETARHRAVEEQR